MCNVIFHVASSGVPIGNICANLFSGFIMSSIPENWPNVFYSFGTIALVWLVIWLSIVYNDPLSHPYISAEECKYLHETIGCIERRRVSVETTIIYYIMSIYSAEVDTYIWWIHGT